MQRALEDFPARPAYGFDDISLAPSRRTVDPDDISLSWQIDAFNQELPMMGSAMDGAINPDTAVEIGRLGGLGVLNLEGLWTRYEDTEAILEEIADLPPGKDTTRLQELYSEPIKPELITERIRYMKAGGIVTAASLTPQHVVELSEHTLEAELDVLVIQGTVVSAEHLSRKREPLNLKEFVRQLQGQDLTVILGNCATYAGAINLMRTGASGVLVGVGPGEACTSREVLGIGVPMVTAIYNAAKARERHLDETGVAVQVIADGGMSKGGHIAKAIACGADAVMIGSPLARAENAPGRGYHWGMAAPHPTLPRGVRVKVEPLGSLEEILLGPAHDNDGRTNLFGALRMSMATCGFENVKSMQKAEVVIAPSIRTEGKSLQQSQGLGMHNANS